MELRRRLLSYARSPTRNGEKKISIPSPSETCEAVRSPRSGLNGLSPRKALKNLFVKKKSRPNSPPESVNMTVLTALSRHQNEDEERELKEIFRHFDADGDGKISAVELRDVLISLGEDLSEKELTAMIEDADSDGDGFIGLTDFIRLNTGKVAGCDADSELRAAFTLFDLDKKGHITAEGLHGILTRLGEDTTLDDCHLMIKRVDFDGDGVVNFGEFKQMMTA